MYNRLIFEYGREALKYIITTFNIAEMHIPYYLCDVVRHTLVKEGCKPIFYHIDKNFFPDSDFSENDYILYPNYWGICGSNIKKLVNIYPKLIVDNAHAYYDKPSGFACFNAGHKFGYKDSSLWIKDENGTDDFIQTDDSATKRQEIFKKLHDEYGKINKLNPDTNSIPFVYPCLTDTIKEADDLAKKLKKEGKTVYRYWSPLPKSFLEYEFYSKLVPIPILPY